MAKDPAMLWYPNDWIGGTMGMSYEEKGAYMDLLMLQFNRGHMTKHMIDQTVGQLFGRIKDKFEVDEDGLFFSPRVDEEKSKRQKYVSSRTNNRSGNNQYSKSPKKIGGHMTSHMENENENEDISINKEEKAKMKISKTVTEKGVLEAIPKNWNKAEFLEHWAIYMDMRKKKRYSMNKNIVILRLKELVTITGGDFGKAKASMVLSADKGYSEFYIRGAKGINTSQTSLDNLNKRDKA